MHPAHIAILLVSAAIDMARNVLRLNGGTIRDSGGGGAALHLDGHVMAGAPTHKVDGSIDTTTPTVTDVFFDLEPPDGNAYGLADWVQAVVRLSKPVAITGAPQLALAIGGRSRMANFNLAARSTDYASQLYFSYVVQAANRDAGRHRHRGVCAAAERRIHPGPSHLAVT